MPKPARAEYLSRPAPAVRSKMAICLAVACLAGGVVSSAGCQRTLFRTDDERSQFDRHDAARGRLAAPFRIDAFGNQQPNLRGRLLRQE